MGDAGDVRRQHARRRVRVRLKRRVGNEHVGDLYVLESVAQRCVGDAARPLLHLELAAPPASERRLRLLGFKLDGFRSRPSHRVCHTAARAARRGRPAAAAAGRSCAAGGGGGQPDARRNRRAPVI
eukprot:7389311-Prymnesium_polylepis.2